MDHRGLGKKAWRQVKPTRDVVRIGIEANIAKLHPGFVIPLAAAMRDAHADNIPIKLFSAYRPPGYGIGGFSNKEDSAHAYGIAGDVVGIGRPGSKSVRKWQAIAQRYGVFSPYGPRNRAEFNHVQGTGHRMVARVLPALRKTITKEGPVDVVKMWDVANRLIGKGPVFTELSARRVYRHRNYRHARKRQITFRSDA